MLAGLRTLAFPFRLFSSLCVLCALSSVTSVLNLSLQSENHPLRNATHQLTARIGIVPTTAHTNGNTKSAINPSAKKRIQKIFFCMTPVAQAFRPEAFLSTESLA